MTQHDTDMLSRWGLPGHISSYPYEGESMLVPVLPQVTTLTIDPDPTIAGDYEFTFPIAAGLNVSATVTSAAETAADFAILVAAEFNGAADTSHLFTAEAVGVTVVLTYRDSTRSFALPTIVQPGLGNVTAAITQVAGGTALRMGVFYAYGAVPTGKGAITATPRRARPARPLVLADALGDIRGVVARTANQTQLDATFNDDTTPDQYLPGQEFPGANRHDVDVIVDPASPGPITLTSAIHVVKAVGLYSIVGAIADTADGANTELVSGGNDPLVRALIGSQSITIGNETVTLARVKVNRTS